jgi:hypothetical protein
MRPLRLPREHNRHRLAVAVATCLLAGAAHAANECKVEYGYHTGSGFTRQDQRKTIDLDSGETRTINQLQMNYVKNLYDHKVQVALAGALNNNFSLNRNQVDPPLGYYLTPVTLKSLKCLATSSDAALGSPEQLIASFKAASRSASEIAQALKSTFNLGAQQIAQLLRSAGFTAADVAAALKSAFSTTPTQIAGWVKAAGYSGQQTVAALRAGVRASAGDTATAVKSAFAATGEQFSAWAKSAGYSGQEVAPALDGVFGFAIERCALLLRKDFAATATLLARWLRATGFAVTDCARALEIHDFTPEQILAAYRLGLQTSADEAVGIQKQLQTIITNINCTRTSCRQPGERMRAAGFPATDTLRALRAHFSLQIKAADEVARYAFGLTLSAADQALVAAGYTVQEVASVR